MLSPARCLDPGAVCARCRTDDISTIDFAPLSEPVEKVALARVCKQKTRWNYSLTEVCTGQDQRQPSDQRFTVFDQTSDAGQAS